MLQLQTSLGLMEVVNQSKGTRSVSLFTEKDLAVYVDSLAIKYVPQEVLSEIKHKSVTRKVFRLQSDDLIMRRFYSIIS